MALPLQTAPLALHNPGKPSCQDSLGLLREFTSAPRVSAGSSRWDGSRLGFMHRHKHPWEVKPQLPPCVRPLRPGPLAPQSQLPVSGLSIEQESSERGKHRTLLYSQDRREHQACAKCQGRSRRQQTHRDLK